MRKVAIALIAIAATCVYFAHRSDARAYDCVRRASPDGRYVAEECTLDWDHGDNPKYVGRVYDTAGKLILRRTFHTPSPEITWTGNHLLFSTGGGDDDFVVFPLSLYDRLNAGYWRLTQW